MALQILSYAAYDHPQDQYCEEFPFIVVCEIAVSIDKHIDHNTNMWYARDWMETWMKRPLDDTEPNPKP